MVEKCFRCLVCMYTILVIQHTTLYHIVLLHNVYSTERALLSLVINFHKLLSVNYAKFLLELKSRCISDMVCVRVYFSHFPGFLPFFSRSFFCHMSVKIHRLRELHETVFVSFFFWFKEFGHPF